jgi:hypothetical protein
MSSTNSTTNYELSQFIGTDKPAWLSDYNGDMAKIDAGIHTAQSTATGADGKADSNTTAIGTLSSLTTTAKTDLVSAINEVDSDVLTAQNTANSASTNANTANTNINKFNLTNKSTLTSSTNKGTINTNISNVQFATDTTSSIFKVYGRVYIENTNGQTGTLSIKIGETSLRPSSNYEINSAAIVFRDYGNTSDVVPRNIRIATNGDITIEDTSSLGSGTLVSYSVIISPCLYFNSDFGDQ